LNSFQMNKDHTSNHLDKLNMILAPLMDFRIRRLLNIGISLLILFSHNRVQQSKSLRSLIFMESILLLEILNLIQ
jgi:hypothetical protein